MNEATSMNRRDFLKTAGAATLIHGCVNASPAIADERPNILFVFSDEHRYQSMSFTEMPEAHTPVMVRMASEGFCFHQCISNYPVCSPYRAMLLTGRWPCQTGVVDNDIALSEAEYTVGDAFRDAGYRTAYVGKWHLGGTRAEPFGFDLSLIWTNTNRHYDESVYHPLERPPVQPRGYNATLMTDQAINYINNSGTDPYLLMVSLNPPHSRFTDAPPHKRALFPDGSLPYRPNVKLENEQNGHISNQNGTPHYEGYHAHIAAIDEELGRILNAVAKSKRGNDTIVIYTSDHGSQFGSQGIGSKRQPFEESLHVPFIVHAPGRVKPDTGSHALIGATDIMPTLCGLAGIPAPKTCRGIDFSGHALRGMGPEPDAQLIMHIAKKNASGGDSHPAPLFRGVRTQRHTYTVNEEGPFHLFDNQEDPYQMYNLVNVSEYTKIREGLHKRLQNLLIGAQDPFLC